MHSRQFKPKTSLAQLELEATIKQIFAQQKKLEKNIDTILHYNKPESASMENASIGIFVIMTIVMYLFWVADSRNILIINGKFIGYDINHNKIVNEPGEREYGEHIHNLSAITGIVWALSLALMMTVHRCLKAKKQVAYNQIVSDKHYKALHLHMSATLENELDNELDNKDKIDIRNKLGLKNGDEDLDFICPMSLSFICNPIEVRSSNDGIRIETKIYDYMSFMDH